MKTRWVIVAGIIAPFLLSALSVHAAEPIQLPSPRLEGGKPLMKALQDRMTIRSFDSRALAPQTLSNLLWAAFGINRPDGRRTAPSARNWQEIDIFLATADGLFLWDAKHNVLSPIADKDHRALTGTQSFVKDAPVNLIYVADYTRVSGGGADRDLLVGADTGFISQNVYLFCASEGLATVVRASIDRDALARVLKLKPEQKIILAQSVGYPKP